MSTTSAAVESTIRITEVSGTELYHRYPRQTSPQEAYVGLDCASRHLFADTRAEVGNCIPVAVYHGHVQRWEIPALKADLANTLLTEIAPLAERVCDGYSSEWDGHNHVAEFDEDAQAALDEIDTLCEAAGRYPEDALQIWDACDWLAGIGGMSRQCRDLGITATTTDEQLAAIAAGLLEEIDDDDDVDGLDGLDKHLEDLREHAIEEYRAEHECATCVDVAVALDDDGSLACAYHATHDGPIEP